MKNLRTSNFNVNFSLHLIGIKKMFYTRVLSLVAISALINMHANAGTPLTVNYAGPQTYTVNYAIAPLVPTSSGVAAPKYSSTPVIMFSGSATLNSGIAIDYLNNLYVPDNSNRRILKIAPNGGVPSPLPGVYGNTQSIAVDGAGSIYLGLYNTTTLTKIPGPGVPGSPKPSGFINPMALVSDAKGNIYAPTGLP